MSMRRHAARVGTLGRTAAGLAVAMAALFTGCGGGGSERPPPELTQRERDSILAQSRLPHASGVGAALRAQDRATGANAGVDSIAASVP
ncbi:MAG: hypothetical protein R3195_13600 [Gemmatimonadota bacterium]|nr:hypothetical protein [Gemmatimonadota bacterium]